MALPTLEPPYPPSVGTRGRRDHPVNVVTMGDGVEQVSIQGVRRVERRYTLVWELLEPAEYKALWAFFDGLGSAAGFLYQLPTDDAPEAWRQDGPIPEPPNALGQQTLSVPIKSWGGQ